jgi:hypothetical protein
LERLHVDSQTALVPLQLDDNAAASLIESQDIGAL